MSIEQAIDKFLKRVMKDLIADQQTKGMVASGDSAASLEVVTQKKSGQLLGNDYFYYQVYGRGPTKEQGSDEKLIDKIEQWVKDKGLDEGLAYPITKKIHEEGTDIYLGKRPGIDLDEIIERNYNTFISDVSKGLADKFVTDTFK